MKKTIIKGCVFAATFIVVLIVSSLFLNRGNTDMTAEMKLPELPLVYVNVGEQHVNMMRGFLNAMDEQYMKESVMPIESDRRLSFSVKKYGQSAVSYTHLQRFLSQPFFVAGQFTGMEGKYVPISETIRSFREILEGEHDDIPESYFLNAGSIDDVLARVK